MKQNNLTAINQLGQSIWLDFFDREIMNNGTLERLINDDGLTGVTSNPAIFEKAISGSADYDEDLQMLSKAEVGAEELFFRIAVKDIQRAADLFKPVYDRTGGRDGFVSLEVSPHLARNTKGTVEQARKLWKEAGRKNVMIKIPGTREGLAAIQQCLSEGININITLLFGLPRYREIAEAYLMALEERAKANLPIDQVASVASFFLSRIDVLIDPLLDKKGMHNLKGEVAIASARKAYQIYKELFNSERFKKLQEKGAAPQRVLWASTSSKDPAFSDVKYVEALIGPDTINTVPLDTLEAFKDHGDATARLEDGLQQADDVLNRLKEAGIDINRITQQLEDEGIEKFNKPFDKLMAAIDSNRK